MFLLRLALSDKINIDQNTVSGAIHTIEFVGAEANLFTNDDMITIEYDKYLITTTSQSIELKCKIFSGRFVNLIIPEENSKLTFSGSWDKNTNPIFAFYTKFNSSFVNFPEYAGFYIYKSSSIRFYSKATEIIIQGTVQLHGVLNVYSEDKQLVVFFHLQLMANSHVNPYYVKNNNFELAHAQVGTCETNTNVEVDLSNLIISLTTYVNLGSNVTCGSCDIDSQSNLIIYYNFQQLPYFYTDYSLPLSITFTYRNKTEIDLNVTEHVNQTIPLYCSKKFDCNYFQEYKAIKVDSNIYNEFLDPELVNPVCINQGDLKCAGIFIPKDFSLTQYIPRTPIPSDSFISYQLSVGEIAGFAAFVIVATILIISGIILFAWNTSSINDEYYPQV